jgi:hypothetical protein
MVCLKSGATVPVVIFVCALMPTRSWVQGNTRYLEGVQKGKFPFFQKNRKKTAKKAYAGARVRVKKRAFGVYFTKVPKKA